ncbi:hypothetical protein PsorP6_011473 [Peronosclerospora sorghi]|uniref:Uncharacterized protein n=1 Tax=Peronosclerospora sorghi TaxID=230839 RepID=A0ACC0WIY9_9STRA|nr:hypothetical protein PsorP6_011473 [Peronosclerospora sorghi]
MYSVGIVLRELWFHAYLAYHHHDPPIESEQFTVPRFLSKFCLVASAGALEQEADMCVLDALAHVFDDDGGQRDAHPIRVSRSEPGASPAGHARHGRVSTVPRRAPVAGMSGRRLRAKKRARLFHFGIRAGRGEASMASWACNASSNDALVAKLWRTGVIQSNAVVQVMLATDRAKYVAQHETPDRENVGALPPYQDKDAVLFMSLHASLLAMRRNLHQLSKRLVIVHRVLREGNRMFTNKCKGSQVPHFLRITIYKRVGISHIFLETHKKWNYFL